MVVFFAGLFFVEVLFFVEELFFVEALFFAEEDFLLFCESSPKMLPNSEPPMLEALLLLPPPSSEPSSSPPRDEPELPLLEPPPNKLPSRSPPSSSSSLESESKEPKSEPTTLPLLLEELLLLSLPPSRLPSSAPPSEDPELLSDPPPSKLPISEPAASLVPLPSRLPISDPVPELELEPSSEPSIEPIPPELLEFCCPSKESSSGASWSRMDVVCAFSTPAFFESAETVLLVSSPNRCCKIFALSLESTLERKDFTSEASLPAWSESACVSACSPFFVLVFFCIPSSISGSAAPMTDSTCDFFAPLFLLSALTVSPPRTVSIRISV